MSLPQHTKAGPGNKLSIEEAAQQVSFSEKELRGFIEQGKIPATLVNGEQKVEQRDLEVLSTLELPE